MKQLAFCFAVMLSGCGPLPEASPPPLPVTKTIAVKVHEQYSENDLDGAALFFDGKFRSVPVIRNRYRLYASDGSFVDVKPNLFAEIKEGEAVESTAWMVDR